MENFDIKIKEGERLDNIGFADLRLLQKPEEFCYGVDAVILADFAASGGGRWDECGYRGDVYAADLGTGTGIIPIILSHKVKAARKIVGVEVQDGSFDRACRNVEINGLQERLVMVQGDVSDKKLAAKVKSLISEMDVDRKDGNDESEKADNNKLFKGFDIVTCNPPYTEGGKGLDGKNQAKFIARTETTGTLEDFIRTAAALLKDKGDFYMVHRPSRLADICCICRKYRIEPKAMRFVSPAAAEIPNILLFHGVLGGGRELKIRQPLAVYETIDGKKDFSQEIKKIYER